MSVGSSHESTLVFYAIIHACTAHTKDHHTNEKQKKPMETASKQTQCREREVKEEITKKQANNIQFTFFAVSTFVKSSYRVVKLVERCQLLVHDIRTVWCRSQQRAIDTKTKNSRFFRSLASAKSVGEKLIQLCRVFTSMANSKKKIIFFGIVQCKCWCLCIAEKNHQKCS